jgi:hypothetical protein
METTTSLIMTFLDAEGGKVNLTLDNPKEEIDVPEIKQCMDTIVTQNIFLVNNLELVATSGAKIVETTTRTFDIEVED